MCSLFLYILIFIIYTWLFKKSIEKKRIQFAFLAIFILSILSGFRYNVGTDWKTYCDYFYAIGVSHNGYMEPLYNGINILIYELTHSFNIFCMVIACIMQILVYNALKKLNKIIGNIYIPMGMYIFAFTLFVNSFNAIRQDLAISIILYGVTYILEKKNLKFILCIFIASLIHYSAIFCLGFLIFNLGLKRFKDASNIIFIVFLGGMLVFSNQIVNILLKILSSFGLYTIYVVGTGNRSYMYLLGIIPSICIVLGCAYNIIRRDRESNFLFKIFVLQLLFQSFGMFVNYADRMALYSSSLAIILFPVVYAKIRIQTNKKILKILTYFWFLFSFVITYYILNGNKIFPYIFKIL